MLRSPLFAESDGVAMHEAVLAKVAAHAKASRSFGASLRIGPAAAVARLAANLSPSDRDLLRGMLSSRREDVLRIVFDLVASQSIETGQARPTPRGGEAVPRAPWLEAGPIEGVGRWSDAPAAPRRLAPELTRTPWEPDRSRYTTREPPRLSSVERGDLLGSVPMTAYPFDPFGISAITDYNPQDHYNQRIKNEWNRHVKEMERIAGEKGDKRFRIAEEIKRHQKEVDAANRELKKANDRKNAGSGSSGSGSGDQGGGSNRPGDQAADSSAIDHVNPDGTVVLKEIVVVGTPPGGYPSDESGQGRSRIPHGALGSVWGHIGQVTPSDEGGGQHHGGEPGEGGKFNPFAKRSSAGSKKRGVHGPESGDVIPWLAEKLAGGVAGRAARPRGSDQVPGHGPDDYLPPPDDPNGDVGPRARPSNRLFAQNPSATRRTRVL